jgi:hypothetical protein
MLPSSLADTVTLLLTDPVTGNARIGARSALIERLLREWVESLRHTAQRSAEGGVPRSTVDAVLQNKVDTSSTICHHNIPITPKGETP